MQGSLYKRGNTWYYRFDIGTDENGKRIQYTRAGTDNKEETAILMREAMREFDNTGKMFIPSEITLSEFLDIWFKECCEKQLRHGTRCDYRNAMNNHIKTHAIGKMKIKDIEPDHLQKYIDEKSLALSPSTMKAHFVVLNKSFKYAVYPKKYIKDSPMIYVEKRTIKKDLDTFEEEEEQQMKVLTLEEFKKIENVLSGTPYLLPTQIAYHTGMRQGEIAGLTWDDIDLNNKVITIKKSMFYNTELKQWELGKTKSGKSRKIRIGETLESILKASRKEILENRMKYGPVYHYTFIEKYSVNEMKHTRIIIDTKENVEKDINKYANMNQVIFVCGRLNGELITNQSIKYSSKMLKKKLPELDRKSVV